MSKIDFADCLYFSSARFTRLIAKISDQQFKRVGLSPTAAFILMSLNDGDDVSPSQLADDLSLDRSTITRFLDKLEQRTLITRTANGRSVIVTLTIDGKQLQPTLKQLWADLNRSYQRLLTVGGEAQLRGLLNTAFEDAREK